MSAICVARKVLVEILGLYFGGTVICDYFSANKKFVSDNNMPVQFCFAHLIRDIKFLTTLSHKNVQWWAEALLKILRKIFELWKTRHRQHPGRYKKAIEKLRKAFLQKEFAARRIIARRLISQIDSIELVQNDFFCSWDEKALIRQTIRWNRRSALLCLTVA